MTIGTDNRILERLRQWEEKEGPLPRSMELYRELLRLQSTARSRIAVPRLSLGEEEINTLIKRGSCLLGFDDLSIDWALFRDVFEDVATLVASHPDVFGEAPANLKELRSSPVLLQEIAKSWFEGTGFPVQIGGADQAILELMIEATMKPFLASHRDFLLDLVDQEAWRRGYCPICGGSPDFGILDKEQGSRWLLCSRCDTKWLFQRLECPYCGSHDQNSLAYFTDDKGLFRLYVCEKCRRYLKAIDLRRAESEVLLPLERFLTVGIDAQAQRQGYSPGAKARRDEDHRSR